MQKWEAEKINALYTELDKLKEENCDLREAVARPASSDKRLDDIEVKLDHVSAAVDHVEQMLSETTTRKSKSK